MTDRLLKESEVLREAESLLISDETRHLNDLEYGNNQALYHLIDRIEDLPSADIPQGEWIQNVFRTDIHRYECSNCKAHHGARYDFCPSCGARMDVNEDDRDYERAVEMAEYERLYEPTYNPEDGSM